MKVENIRQILKRIPTATQISVCEGGGPGAYSVKTPVAGYYVVVDGADVDVLDIFAVGAVGDSVWAGRRDCANAEAE